MRHATAFFVPLAVGLALAVSAAEARAQEPAEGETVGEYTVTGSSEIGIRGVKIEGSENRYRSDYNYSPGVRIFDSSVLMRAEDGEGLPFDSLLVTSSGWGGDPSGSFRANARKLRLYEFDANVRGNHYYNNLRNLALGQHVSDYEHRTGDFDLTLLPQRDLSFNLGYSYDRTEGDSLTTYDFSRDEFPLTSPVRTRADDYRFGVDAKVGGVNLSFLQGFRRFRDDTTFFVDQLEQGNSVVTPSLLTGLRRDFPQRGRIAYSRFSFQTLLGDRVDLAGRLVYSSATSRFDLFEQLAGRNYLGQDLLSEVSAARGDAKRPQTVGDLGVTWLATDRLRISNSFQVSVFQISGGQDLRIVTTPATAAQLVAESLVYRNTAYRRVSNQTEVDYQFSTKFQAHVGYRYTDRRVELETLDLGGEGHAEPEIEEFDNRTNSFFGGFRAKPVKRWTLYLDLDSGESDNVFTRVSNYEYTSFRARSIFRPTDTLALNLSVVTRDNENPTTTDDPIPQRFGTDSNTRIYSAAVDWNPRSDLAFSGGYTHHHITSEASIFLFVNFVPRTGLSRYFMKDNYVYLSATARVHPRLSLYGQYQIHKDTGQGDRVAPDPSIIISGYPQQSQNAETRVAVRLHDRVDLNFGYQFLDYKERFVNLQHYRAHLPYGSLRFYIGRR